MKDKVNINLQGLKMKDNKERIRTNEQIHNIAVKLQEQQEIRENLLKGTFLENKTAKNVENTDKTNIKVSEKRLENVAKNDSFIKDSMVWLLIFQIVGACLVPAIILILGNK